MKKAIRILACWWLVVAATALVTSAVYGLVVDPSVRLPIGLDVAMVATAASIIVVTHKGFRP